MVHDALIMVVDAIQRAGVLDGEKVKAALETCDLEGITGHIKIGPTHDPVGKTAWLIQIVGPDMKLKEQYAAVD